jgi:hypothetical protein
MDKRDKIKEVVDRIFVSSTKNYIFVYAPPKVGSTTLVSSLRVSLGRSFNVIHIHDDIMLSVLTGIKDITVNELINYISSQGNNIYVIDVFRTPIERKMSEFFEKLSPYHFNNTDDNICNYSLKRITDRFNKLFPHLANGDHYFDKFEIDTPIDFDKEKKYSIQQINNINYIKLRLCDSNIWNTILTEIFKTEIVLINDYKTENKKIGKLYNRFKEVYKLPSNYYDLINDSSHLKFYYSEAERNEYLDNWNNKLCDVFNPYTEEEYQFYVNLYLENQVYADIQYEHYIDNGCFCNYCCKKRRDIFFRAKQGETNFEKIIHCEVVNEDIKKKTAIIKDLNKKIKNLVESKKKFKTNQFAVKL